VGIPSSAVVHCEPDEKNISTAQWLKMSDYVAMAIVCGSNKLYDHVSSNTSIPIIRATGHTCNMYVAADADYTTVLRVVTNAKLQRPNATNCINNLLVDEGFPYLKELVEELANAGLRLLGDQALQARGTFPALPTASEEDWLGLQQNGFTNFNRLNLKLISAGGGVEEAAVFIETFGSSQSDGIITTSEELAERFVQRVDSACVYVNASTRLSSGECLGVGADLAIATSRVQCRGPVSIHALTTRKFVVRSKGPSGAIR
jgi:glutamate-5-semialdehyde dehydrogenase